MDAVTATVCELNDELGRWSVAALNAYQAELAVAVLSLARESGQPWRIGHDEPTVALLRISARLALLQPDIATAATAQLLELLRLNRLS